MSNYTFGRILRQYRDDHDLSQQELASILGTTKQVLSRYETGQRDPKITTVQEYSNKLNIPISILLGKQSQDESTVSSHDTVLTDSEMQVLSILRKMSADQQQAVLDFLNRFSPD